MKGEGVGRTSPHDTTDPHPALRADLSLARERRLFVAALETVRTLFFTVQAKETSFRGLASAHKYSGSAACFSLLS